MRIKLDISNGRKIWFGADFHLFHANVIRFDNRPFKNVNEMNETIIERWNSLVGEKDEAFFLGDLSWAPVEKTKPLVDRLNGKIHYILGNHDKFKDIAAYKRFESINDYVDLTLINGKESTHFTLMHYPIFSWNRIHHGSYHIHGHCHHNLHHGEDKSYYVNRRVIDAGCNGHDYYPISHVDIIEQLKHVTNERASSRD